MTNIYLLMHLTGVFIDILIFFVIFVKYLEDHFVFVSFSSSERKSHSEVCEECAMGVWRGCTRLCFRTDDLCSLSQVGFYPL